MSEFNVIIDNDDVTVVQVGSVGPPGQQGNQGLVGAQGNQGLVGAQGLQGNQGLVGAQGFQGFQGNQGLVGAQGLQGRQGFQGNQGLVGAQGLQGNQGLQGRQGLVGAQGFQGNQGNAGLGGFAVDYTFGSSSSPSNGQVYLNGATIYAFYTDSANNDVSGILNTLLVPGNYVRLEDSTNPNAFVYGLITSVTYAANIYTIQITSISQGGVYQAGDAIALSIDVAGPTGEIGAQGFQGSIGETGSGATGATGANGSNGEVGGMGSTWTAVSSGVGNGNVFCDTSGFDTLNAIDLSSTDSLGDSFGTVIGTLTVGSYITISNPTGPTTTGGIYQITSITANSGYYAIGLSMLATIGATSISFGQLYQINFNYAGVTGWQGQTGAAGGQGFQGPVGGQGSQGQFGGFTIPYTPVASSGSASNGQMANWSSGSWTASNTLYLSANDYNGNSVSTTISLLTVGSIITVYDLSDDTNYGYATVSSITFFGGTPGYFGVTYANAVGNFPTNTPSGFSFSLIGPTGSQGSQGSDGPVGPTGATGATGPGPGGSANDVQVNNGGGGFAGVTGLTTSFQTGDGRTATYTDGVLTGLA